MHKPIIICGPTCSGKSSLALRIAEKIGGVIINADSQQVYKELPILSAQPTEEEKSAIPHYLYSIVSGDKLFNVADWLGHAKDLLKSASKPVVFVGGTGLYYHALFHGISLIPEISHEIRSRVRSMTNDEIKNALNDHSDNNSQRIKRRLEVKLETGFPIEYWHQKSIDHEFKPEDFSILNVVVSRETLYQKINSRLHDQVKNGALEEVKTLAALGIDKDLPIMKAHGVPEFIRYFNREISLEDAISKAQQNVRNYAKRQMTWFRNQLPDHKIDISPEVSDNELESYLK